MNENKRLKMAVIAGASYALKLKSKDWKISDEEVIQKVSKDINSILKNIDE